MGRAVSDRLRVFARGDQTLVSTEATLLLSSIHSILDAEGDGLVLTN